MKNQISHTSSGIPLPVGNQDDIIASHPASGDQLDLWVAFPPEQL
jgi:hypothetical protein